MKWNPASWSFAACCCTALALAGCFPALVVDDPVITGTYTGTTQQGTPMTLTLEHSAGGFIGHGMLDGVPLIVSGARVWAGTGGIGYLDGSSATASVHLSQNGQQLVLEIAGDAPVVLRRGGTAIAPPPGPFSGRYRGRTGGDGPPSEATVVQHDTLVSGVAVLLGQSAGITARTVAADRIEGVLTFADESQAGFRASLSADGRSLTVEGLGDPLVMNKR